MGSYVKDKQKSDRYIPPLKSLWLFTGRYCGSENVFIGDTSDSYAYIKFVSDGSDQDSGFKIRFTSSLESKHELLLVTLSLKSMFAF